MKSVIICKNWIHMNWALLNLGFWLIHTLPCKNKPQMFSLVNQACLSFHLPIKVNHYIKRLSFKKTWIYFTLSFMNGHSMEVQESVRFAGLKISSFPFWGWPEVIWICNDDRICIFVWTILWRCLWEVIESSIFVLQHWREASIHQNSVFTAKPITKRFSPSVDTTV